MLSINLLRRKWLGVFAGLALFAAGTVWAQVDTMASIKQKGKIVVGVKADYKPFGFLDPSGKIIGMEPDLAQDVANKLGVKLELVPVLSSNRMEFLNQGRVDLMIATMSENAQRRQAVGVIEPLYYAGGSSILTRKSNGFKKWSDLRGRRVCATQGAYYNRLITERYGVEIVAFAGVPEAQNSLLINDCIAFLQDSTLHAAALSSGDPRWADFESPLPTEDEVAWAIAVLSADRDRPFGKFMSEMVVGWHKSGRIVALEKKWGLLPSPFVQQMQEKYK